MNDDEEERIRRACERLVARYSIKADLGAADEAADCYSVDGVLEIAGKRYAGRDVIRGRVVDAPEGQVSRHITSNILIDVISPDTAVGNAYVALYRGQKPAGSNAALPMGLPLLIGYYEDRYVRTKDGWRFAHRKLNVDFRRESAA